MSKKPFTWIRFDNSEPARAQRRMIAAQTYEAIDAAGYVIGRGIAKLSNAPQMVQGTLCISPSLGNRGRVNVEKNRGTNVIVRNETVIACALDVSKLFGSRQVAVVNAASSYHCGGGYLSGGRHALEEAFCVQTSLFKSISHMRNILDPVHKLTEVSEIPYIPVDGCVLSPSVEVMRSDWDDGYTFFDAPVTLGAVVSVAMFNRNPSLRDCPLDSPSENAKYEEGIREKVRSCLAAVVKANCTVLIMPDVGCGVFQNDANTVGQLFAEVLKKEFWGVVSDVYLVGGKKFKDAVLRVLGDEAADALGKLPHFRQATAR